MSCLIHAVAGRTSPAGERGSAAGSLLSFRCPSYTWACVLCRPSPEFPFRFIWVLGRSTWHLALDPSSVLHLQHKLCPYFDALQHLPPPQLVPRQQPGRSWRGTGWGVFWLRGPVFLNAPRPGPLRAKRRGPATCLRRRGQQSAGRWARGGLSSTHAAHVTSVSS
jgi:hypothetical protein